jgi:hypothetical protein
MTISLLGHGANSLVTFINVARNVVVNLTKKIVKVYLAKDIDG